jgi:hypothetical protein
VLEIQQIPSETRLTPPVSTIVPSGNDTFANMPLEIITYIALHLSAEDYLNARLASGSFHPIFHQKQFWASRFLPNADRSWVFESQDWGSDCDPLWLYRRTVNGSPGMKNRERVWRLVEYIQKILSLEWIEPILQCNATAADEDWLRAAGDIQPTTGDEPNYGFVGGCREFKKGQVNVSPDQLSYLAFYLIHPGNTTYVTGIEFHWNTGGAVCLGYTAEDVRTVSITCLTGFRLAVGSRGVQGIQCILDNGRESPWIGCADVAPISDRLLSRESLSSIQVGFDVGSSIPSVYSGF